MNTTAQVATGALEDFLRHQKDAGVHQAAIRRAFSNRSKPHTMQMLAAHDSSKMLVFESRELWVRFGKLSIETQKMLVHSACNGMALMGGVQEAEIHGLEWNPSGTMMTSLKIKKISGNTLALSLGEMKLVEKEKETSPDDRHKVLCAALDALSDGDLDEEQASRHIADILEVAGVVSSEKRDRILQLAAREFGNGNQLSGGSSA